MSATIDVLRKIKATMMEHRISPKVVANIKQAEQMTQADPAGHVWYVGDEYYEVRTTSGNFGISAS